MFARFGFRFTFSVCHFSTFIRSYILSNFSTKPSLIFLLFFIFFHYFFDSLFFMAQYKTHSFVNIIIALPLFLWGIFYTYKPNYEIMIIFSICFIYSTLYMSPDVDISNKIKLFSIRGLLTLPFRFYSLIFKHSGIFHSFFLGTITRVLWLSSFFYIFLFFLNKPFINNNQLFTLLKGDYFLYGFAAIVLADLCHLILDFKFKRLR